MTLKKFLELALQAFWRKVRYPRIRQIAMGCKPDPFKFSLLKREYVNGNTIILANYEGCKSFGGNKLMVLLGKHDGILSVLDPHFIDEDYPVVARFAPTKEGWDMARLVANNYN